LQKEGRDEDDFMVTPKTKGRRSETTPEILKKKTPGKKGPADDGGMKKRLNILYKTAFDYTVSPFSWFQVQANCSSRLAYIVLTFIFSQERCF
jgi:hypothetical protein